MAGAAARPHRRRIHGPAARGDAGLHARQPALFRAARRRRQGRAPASSSSPISTADGRRRGDHRRQRARAARPASPTRGISGTWTAGPRLAIARRRRSTRSPSTPSSAPRASACGGWNAGRRRSRRWSAPTRRKPRAPRCSPRPTSYRHGRRIPRTAGRHGPLLRAAMTAKTPRRRRRPRPLRAAAARPTPVPTAPVSIAVALGRQARPCSPASSRSARSPPAPAIPMRCAAPRLGVIRIIRENGLRLDLRQLVACAPSFAQPTAGEPLAPTTCSTSSSNASASSFAPRARGTTCWPRLRRRRRMTTSSACWRAPRRSRHCSARRDGADLLAAYRRAANILRIEEQKDGHA